MLRTCSVIAGFVFGVFLRWAFSEWPLPTLPTPRVRGWIVGFKTGMVFEHVSDHIVVLDGKGEAFSIKIPRNFGLRTRRTRRYKIIVTIVRAGTNAKTQYTVMETHPQVLENVTYARFELAHDYQEGYDTD